jgi:hypothetical protein
MGMLLGFAFVMYVSFHLHGIQAAILGMAYAGVIALCVARARGLEKEAEAIFAEVAAAPPPSQ